MYYSTVSKPVKWHKNRWYSVSEPVEGCTDPIIQSPNRQCTYMYRRPNEKYSNVPPFPVLNTCRSYNYPGLFILRMGDFCGSPCTANTGEPINRTHLEVPAAGSDTPLRLNCPFTVRMRNMSLPIERISKNSLLCTNNNIIRTYLKPDYKISVLSHWGQK